LYSGVALLLAASDLFRLASSEEWISRSLAPITGSAHADFLASDCFFLQVSDEKDAIRIARFCGSAHIAFDLADFADFTDGLDPTSMPIALILSRYSGDRHDFLIDSDRLATTSGEFAANIILSNCAAPAGESLYRCIAPR